MQKLEPWEMPGEVATILSGTGGGVGRRILGTHGVSKQMESWRVS